MATVLVTGAGGAAVPTLIAHLQGLGHRVVAVDADEHAAGLYTADAGYVVPRGDSPEWVPTMQSICEREGVQVVIPLVDEELAQAHDLTGVHALAPRREFVATCLDKWACMMALRHAGVRVPYTNLFDGRTEPYFPAIIKPRVGRGSRGVHRLQHRGEVLMALIERRITFSDDTLAQEYIDGPEYTVSVVCDHTNTVHAVVPKRIIDKRGITRLAATERNERIDAVCRRVAEALKPHGPYNVQLRLRDGEPYIFEINPRFSGTVNLTTAAGCDEVGGLIALALGEPYTFGEWREGVTLVRRYADVCVEGPLRKVERA